MIRLILRSMWHYRRPNLGILAGVALASAVLTGALLVGDSVDYSLRSFALARLGKIDYAMDTRSQLIAEDLVIRMDDALDANVAGILRLPGMALRQNAASARSRQVNQVQVLGVDQSFWRFGAGAYLVLRPYETAIGVRLAQALEVEEGDEISLRVATPALMSRDAPLSWRGEDQTQRMRYTVIRILDDDEMGRFDLSPSQIAPYNAFVDREFLQTQVEHEGRINLVVTAGASMSAIDTALGEAWNIADVGIRVRSHGSGVIQVESERVFLDSATTRAALAIPGAQGIFTYLATSLFQGEKTTPYFFVVAGSVPEELRDDEIVINRWMADELSVQVGDVVKMTYAKLEPNNTFSEDSRAFKIHSIREMDSLTAERELMPQFPGLSDVESCSQWDVGMPMDEALLNDEANEAYWDEYRDTPKAFVTLNAGQSMWENRFGNLTAVRFHADATDPESVLSALSDAVKPADAGLVFIPVRETAAAAVAQAMNFGGLFLAMSFFLIIAALLLAALLFVFGVQQRASQIGILLATGFRVRQISFLLLGEGAVIALIGSAVGALAGAVYTRALIYGLSGVWRGAVANATILFHADPMTLFIGGGSTFLCAIVAIRLALGRLSRWSARDLLSSHLAQSVSAVFSSKDRLGRIPTALTAIVALAIIIVVRFAAPESATPAFFAAGALLLIAGVGACRHVFIRAASGAVAEKFTSLRFAILGLARRSGRSLSIIIMLAAGCFMVFAVSAMQEDLEESAQERSSGTGGFALFAEATIPLLKDPLASMEGGDVSGVAVKVRDGDDASCLNLNQAQTPRLLGVDPSDFVERGAFGESAKALWALLESTPADGSIPALVGDTNTAMWTLKKKTGVHRGDVLKYRDESGNDVSVKLVGKLPVRLSVFQGSILVSQANFTRLFPAEAGFRMFLIDAPPNAAGEIAESLEREFERYGLEAAPAAERLLEFHAVESTYLSMFLVLGGLGLAVGSIGVSALMLRNLYERRPELAMLFALGFRYRDIGRLQFLEYGCLLAAGLGVGAVAAAIAMIPAMAASHSTVPWKLEILVACLIVTAYAGTLYVAVRIGIRNIGIQSVRTE